MIFRALWIIAGCWLAAAAASAQSVPIRSGEHDGFSRLVLQVPPGTAWDLQQQGANATLELKGLNIRFDTSGVFDKIPKSRLTAIRQTDRGAPLNLALGCNCPVTAFLQSDVFLVVDIADPTDQNRPQLMPAPTGPAYRFAAGPSSTLPVLPSALGQLTHPDHLPSHSPDHLPTPQREQHAAMPLPKPAQSATSGTARGDFRVTAPAAELNLTQIRLLEEISRAANQGLLTPRTELDPASSDEPAPAKSVPEQLNLRATSRADLDRPQIQIRNTPDTAESRCLPGELVDVPSWADDRPFAHQLGDLRAKLVSETGMFQEEAAIKLAQFYIFQGFGSEAASLLQKVNSTDQSSTILRAIAHQLDAPQPQRFDIFDDQRECATDVALWAFLAESGRPKAPAPDTATAILRAFSKLPKHLKKHLGPRLSRQFLLAENPERASEVLRAIDPAHPEPEDAQTMVQADIDLKKGKTDSAQKALQKVVEGQSEHSPQALIELIQTSYDSGKPPGKPLSGLADAYHTEFKGTDLGNALKRALILALIMENNFEQALSRYTEGLKTGDLQDKALVSDIYLAATDRADDSSFLALTLDDLQKIDQRLSQPALTQVAERILNLGFAEQAEALLNQQPAGRRNADRRLLRARIALANRKPNRALVELAGLQSAAADPLRAQALSLIGEFDSAAESYDTLQTPEQVARSRWLQGAWDLMPADGAGRFGEAADLAENLGSETPPAEGPLSEARILLETSAQTRADIEALLSTVADPDADPARPSRP